jgi:hypothetical protein
MVVIISRLFVVVVVVVATLPSSFVAFTTKLRVVVIIFFWDECDDVLRSKEDSKKRVAREFNKDDDFGTQQGDAFMLCAFITCALYLRAMKVTTRVEIRFRGKSLQKKKRRFSAFEISSALEPSQLRRERRQKQQQRQKHRQGYDGCFHYRHSSRELSLPDDDRERGEKTFRLRRKKISR